MAANIDIERAKQRLSQVPYPISKDTLIQGAQQQGIDAQSLGILERLPDKSFASLQDLLDAIKAAAS